MSRKPNVRRSNGTARTKLRRWLKAQGRPCWICVAFGRKGDIDYSLPHTHPFAFEVDELVPIALGGDPRCCNEWRGAMTVEQVLAEAARGPTHNRRSEGRHSGAL